MCNISPNTIEHRGRLDLAFFLRSVHCQMPFKLNYSGAGRPAPSLRPQSLNGIELRSPVRWIDPGDGGGDHPEEHAEHDGLVGYGRWQ